MKPGNVRAYAEFLAYETKPIFFKENPFCAESVRPRRIIGKVVSLCVTCDVNQNSKFSDVVIGWLDVSLSWH